MSADRDVPLCAIYGRVGSLIMLNRDDLGLGGRPWPGRVARRRTTRPIVMAWIAVADVGSSTTLNRQLVLPRR